LLSFFSPLSLKGKAISVPKSGLAAYALYTILREGINSYGREYCAKNRQRVAVMIQPGAEK
jgi:hypothetical protein